MRLQKARVRSYRSIRDSGWFDIEPTKTILVGPNEAGKTVLLRALEKINPPDGNIGFEPLRDFPRSELNNLSRTRDDGRSILPIDVTVVEAHFSLESGDLDAIVNIDPEFANVTTYVFGRRLDNGYWHDIVGGSKIPSYGEIRRDLSKVAGYADLLKSANADEGPISLHVDDLLQITSGWNDSTPISGDRAQSLSQFLLGIDASLDDASLDIDSTTERERLEKLAVAAGVFKRRQNALSVLFQRLPTFVYFSSYFRVHPRIHLGQLATRIEQGVVNENPYDRGNTCLFKLLGFDAQELSDLGVVTDPDPENEQSVRDYQDQLDNRSYQLNAASTQLTKSIKVVWKPNPAKAESDRLRITADQQYLKVVVEDDLGVEVELDQRSEGFQWLVSFFVVFSAEAKGSYENAILLLDEPGLSLHGLKQREFCATISRLAESNQLLYSTHSPFMVGSDELDLVRVVEMNDRITGTVVHTTVAAGDSTALLPLQEALGYDLAQNLLIQNRNLILEGLTDYWYVEAVSTLLRASREANLNENIALIPASNAGRVVYFATILHANRLKVAALLDSDAAGDAAASVETLIHTLKNKNILRTKDAYMGSAKKPEIEDLLRDTLVDVAKSELGWDITAAANSQPNRSILDIFADKIGNRSFSKYRLAKAFLRWTREHEANDLTETECNQWKVLVATINKALK